MILIHQKQNLKIYLKNDYFNNPSLVKVLEEIINKGFITKDQKLHFNSSGNLNTWAFDFRIPLLNSAYTKVLFPFISEYLSELGYETIGLKGFGALPFISLSQYGNIKNIYIAREQKKTHGFRQEIEGIENITPTSKNICLIDDIINSGGSLQKTHHTFRNNGINVDKYLCLVNFTWREKKINPNILDSILEVYK